MANNFSSNFTATLARVFLKKFESSRVMSKMVDTQLLDGKFNPSTGDTVYFKRPTDYTTTRTSTGDISGATPDDIITGKAKGEVQDYFTVWVDYDEADEAIKMDQIDELLAPMATRIITDLEVDFAGFMMRNSGLYAGSVGTAVTTWGDVAEASAVLRAHGIPADSDWSYACNPFTATALADVQRSLGAVDSKVNSAFEQAVMAKNFAGMKVISATTLPTYTTDAGSDRAGTINGSPTVTYVGAKDTMTQVIPVTGLNGGSDLDVKAGEIVQISGRNRLNLSTRKAIVDGSGNKILFTGVVTEDVTLTSGAGNLTIAGPAIFESGGAFNTVDSALTSGDVVTLLGSESTMYQPNLFWHKQAFSIGSVPIKKLHSTDTLMQTKDGIQMRVSKYADGDKNRQTVRFDLRPAYACLNPFFAGQGYGRA